MSIVAGDLKFKKSAVVDNATTCGGVIDNTTTTSDIGNDYFPDVTGSERTAGLEGTDARYRKFFFKNEQPGSNGAADLELGNPKVYIKSWSPGNDRFRIAPATNLPNDSPDGVYKQDTKADQQILGGTVWKGCGALWADINNGATTLTVRTEGVWNAGTDAPIAVGDTIAVVDIPTDYKEFHTVTSMSSITPITMGADNIPYSSFTVDIAAPGIIKTGSPAYDAAEHVDELVGSSKTVITDTGKSWTINEHAEKVVICTVATNTGNVGLVRRIVSNTATALTLGYGFPYDVTSGVDQFEIINTVVTTAIDLNLGATAPASYVGDGIIATFNSGSPSYTKGSSTLDGGNTGTGVVTDSQITVYPEGVIDDSITFVCQTSSPAATFSATGTIGGNYNTLAGATLTEGVSWTAVNTENSKNMITLSATALSSVSNWVAGDEFRLNTTSSARAFWVKHVVPAGTAPHASNRWYLGASGDTV
jgi:hypothetical protein